MTRLVVCMDCPNYQKGGYCTHRRKDVAALAPACDYAKTINQKFNPEDTEEDMTTLSAKEYQETPTPAPAPAPETAYEIELAEEMPAPLPTKVCPRCKRELLHEAFGKHARTRDGLQPYCRRCRAEARQGKTSRPEHETKTSYIKTDEQPKTTAKPKTVVVRETLTDKEMVDILREHGWTVTCYRTITEEL